MTHMWLYTVILLTGLFAMRCPTAQNNFSLFTQTLLTLLWCERVNKASCSDYSLEEDNYNAMCKWSLSKYIKNWGKSQYRIL